MSSKKKFGDFLKQQRNEKNWSQPEASEAIGIEQSYLSKLENGKALPSTEMFDKLMNTYQFTLHQVSDDVTDTELEKLKDIVLIRDLIITHKKKNDRSRRLWMVTSILLMMIGGAVLSAGLLLKENVNVSYIYESKGVILEGEPSYLFAELPSYQLFQQQMQFKPASTELKSQHLFNRLDYKELNSPYYQGNYFDRASEKGSRRFYLVDKVEFAAKQGFYQGVSFGIMILVGAFGSMYMSRKW